MLRRGESMDDLRAVHHELSSTLHESIEVVRRAGYLARRFGAPRLDHHIEDDLVPALVAFADDDRTATHPGSVGHLLALLEADTEAAVRRGAAHGGQTARPCSTFLTHGCVWR
jgi:hypothetical protein